MMAQAPPHVTYVVVLTKADKKDSPKILLDTLEAVRSKLESSCCPADTPVLLTSSVNRLGRDHMWRFLRLAADPTAFERLD